MGFASEAQRNKFKELVAQGKITQQKFNEWNDSTAKNIPDRVRVKSFGVVGSGASRKKKARPLYG